MKRRLVVLLGLLMAVSVAAQSVDGFAYREPIRMPSSAALVEIDIPDGAYVASRSTDLADVRIVNAAGEMLPMARLPSRRQSSPVRVALAPVALTPRLATMPAEVTVIRGHGDQSVEVDVRRRAAESKDRGFLVDTAKLDGAIDRVTLQWGGAPVFEASLRVDVSDDLNAWRTVVPRVSILALGTGPARIEQRQIEMPQVHGRYLRFVWLGAAPDIRIETLMAERQDPVVQHARRSVTLGGLYRPGDGIYFLASGRFPVDGVGLVMDEDNDVVSATLESSDAMTGPWRWRGRLMGYRLASDSGMLESAPTRIAPTRDRYWRVRPIGPESLGKPPRLRLGWQPERVVFVARGHGPYLLLAGNETAASAWRPPAQLIPRYGFKDAAPVTRGEIASGIIPIVMPGDGKDWTAELVQWLFWGALVLGVGVLGWMARSLIRDMGAGSDSDMR